MVRGPYYVVLLSFFLYGSRLIHLSLSSREPLSSVAQHGSKSIRLIDVVATVRGDVAGIFGANEENF